MTMPNNRERSVALREMIAADNPHWTAANRWALLEKYSVVCHPIDVLGAEVLILDSWWAADAAYDPPGPDDDLRLGGAS
jgi:hypothetical protein